MHKLTGFTWVPQHNSHMGCLLAALAYLKIDISAAWLYGVTGYAFITNISAAADESCPTAWDYRMIFDLAPNAGIQISGLNVSKAAAGERFPDRQREAQALICAAIDRGLPCYGWEVQPWMPEFGLITGYDDAGYYYGSYAAGGPVKWEEYGDHDVKVIQAYAVQPCPPAPARQALRAVLDSVVRLSASPRGWTAGDMYTSGPAAFDVWANALESAEARRDGTSYNALVWHECRVQAVEFLQEAHQRLSGLLSPACDRALSEAAAAYAQSRSALADLTRLVPMDMTIWDGFTPLHSPAAAEIVRAAGQAERRALQALQDALPAM
jgi:hypothetical protein